MTQEEVKNAPPPPYPSILPESQRTPVIREWNPDAPGNTPGEYGGYYDVDGNLHCEYANVPRKGSFYAVTFIDEKGRIRQGFYSWNPNDIGTTPGPYGGYYDAAGKLHCKDANMPRDVYGFPLVSYHDEYGSHALTYPEMEKSKAEERRIAAGEYNPGVGLTDEEIANLRRTS